MNEEEVYLLKVLKGFVLDENPGVFCGDWNKLTRLANIHSVIGILGYSVMNQPDVTSAQIVDSMRKQCLQTIALISQRSANMKELIRQMNNKGITHLLFKGYIVKDYYPIPELRTFGDIDFLIHPEDRQICDELMLQQGFVKKTDWEPVYSYKRGAEYYEIHTDVMEVDVSDKADYKDYFHHIWEHAHLTNSYTWELSPEFHFLYLLTHIAKHICGSGAGIRMYMDIAVFIKHYGNELDWKYIQDELDKLKLTDFANITLTVVQKYFGVKCPIALSKIDDSLLEDFIEFTMAGGVFGYVGRDSGLIALKNYERSEESVSRLHTLKNRLFPNAVNLENRYTYLQGRHWLLPFAWIHRFFKTKNTWSYHSKEAKSIMNTDSEEVLKLKRIYKAIGL